MAEAKKKAKKKDTLPRLPFRFPWAIETRRSNERDASRIGFLPASRRIHQAGVTTYYADELLVIYDVALRDLPSRLRALADHYDRIRELPDEEADVIVARRRWMPETEE